MVARTTIVNRKPIPIPIPSRKESKTLFFEAKASALPKTIQLTMG